MSDQELCMFKYVVIAREGSPLICYPFNSPDLHEKTLKILKMRDLSSPFSVIEQNNLLYTASTDSSGIVFLCVCDKNVETHHVGNFLKTLKQQWTQNYGAITQTITPGEKDDEFGPKIKELLDNFNNKLRPTISSTLSGTSTNDSADAANNNNNGGQSPNLSEPLLDSRDDGSLSSIPNPFANPHMMSGQDGFSNEIHEDFDEVEADPNEGHGNCVRFFQRNRLLIMILIGIMLILYFTLAYYCESFNLLSCSSSQSDEQQ